MNVSIYSAVAMTTAITRVHQVYLIARCQVKLNYLAVSRFSSRLLQPTFALLGMKG